MKGFVFKVIKASAGILTSRVLGLLRDSFVAAVFGANKLTDAFFIAFAIPNLFRALFAEGALSSAFVPILSDKKIRSTNEANAYLSRLIIVLSCILIVLVFFISIFSNYVIAIFMPGYVNDHTILTSASKMLVIVMPYLMLVSIAGLISGYLNVIGSYYIPNSSTALLNISMISGAALGGYYYGGDIIYLAYGVLVGGILQLIYVFLYSIFKGFHFSLKNEKDPDVKKTFLLIIPSIVGVGVSQINFTVDRVLASFLSYGSISYLYYANRLFQFPLGVFSVAISSVSLTEISKSLSEGDVEKANGIIDKSILALFVIIIPATIGLIMLSDEICSLIYQRRAFDKMDVLATSSALKMYSSGLIFYSLTGLLTRVYYSQKNTITPVKIAVFMCGLNFIFDIILMKFFSHSGIALASSIVAMINTICLYIFLKNYRFQLSKYRHSILKVFFSSLIMGISIYLLKINHIHVLISVFSGVIIYLVTLKMFKIRVMEMLR